MAQTASYLKTEKEYNQLQPKHAADDARRDIKEKAIKLYFEDRAEFPSILAIDTRFTQLFPYTHISIGQGCLDPINDENCPTSYNKSYDQALLYGRLYNQTVADHFDTLQKETSKEKSSHQSVNATAQFLGNSSDHAQIIMELADIHPLFGGRDIQIKGDGSAWIHCLRTQGDDGQLQSFEYKVKLKAEETQRLVEAFIKHDFITLKLSENQELDPDTARPTLVLRNSNGQSYRLKGWVTNLPPGPESRLSCRPIECFDRIYKEMLRIERCIQNAHTQRSKASVNEE